MILPSLNIEHTGLSTPVVRGNHVSNNKRFNVVISSQAEPLIEGLALLMKSMCMLIQNS